MECTKCGADLDFRDAFCSKCGQLTDRGKGAGELAGRYTAELFDSLSKLISSGLAYASDRENRIQVGIGAAVAALALVTLTSNPISRGVSGIFVSSPEVPTFNADGTPNFAEYEDVFIGEQVEYLVTGSANVRDFPTSQGSKVIGALTKGETVMARSVKAFDADSQWLKLASGGYVWAVNFVHIDADAANSSGALHTGAEFPDFLRGRWSSMDTCRGYDMNAEIDISANSITFYESTGRLTDITYDDRGKPIYHLAMSGEGQTWTASYAINITANGLSIFLDTVGRADEPSLVYHNTEAGCGSLFFED